MLSMMNGVIKMTISVIKKTPIHVFMIDLCVFVSFFEVHIQGVGSVRSRDFIL